MGENEKTQWWFSLIAPEHPVWGLLKIMLITACVTLLMSFNSTKFDRGEVQTAVGTFISSLILEGVRARKSGS